MAGRDDEAQQALRSVVLGPHPRLDALAADVAGAHPTNDEPRRIRELADTFMATMSRHLAAVDDTLLPVARGHLDGGHDLVSAYVAQARELEQGLHAVKARMYGDVNAKRLHGDTLWTDVRRLLAEHESHEGVLVDAVAASLSDDDLTDLAQRLQHNEENAPTRPHAYTPHTGLLGRLVHRAWSMADRFWDHAEARVIPHRVRPPHPRQDSPLSQYFRGTPHFEQPRREPHE